MRPLISAAVLETFWRRPVGRPYDWEFRIKLMYKPGVMNARASAEGTGRNEHLLCRSSLTKAQKARANSVRNGGANGEHLRPFFGYYGGKWRDAVKLYPAPEHDTIVEPFAGSAGYSLRYANRQVILCELDPILAEVWKYLIRVKRQEILSIPDLADDESVDDLHISQEARWLVGLWLNRGTAGPRKSPSKWMRDGIRPGSFWGERVRQTIAAQIGSIRHWKIHNHSYADCRTRRVATWFVDPPYENAGQYYKYSSNGIDYASLSAWCRSRPGQVIVCENAGATWLPFQRLADVKTVRRKRRSKEVYWLNTFRDGAHDESCKDRCKR